jgi:shikimate kinase
MSAVLPNRPAKAQTSIALIGPGGSGKTTIGALIAERLGIEFFDLDRRLADHVGDISDYINRRGYEAYARENIETYRALSRNIAASRVMALSSGFMTYPRDIHPEYADLRSEIERSPTTFVLVPSLDPERCVAETVRRQMTRPFSRSTAREESVIRERFPIYVGLSSRKIETMRPLAAIVDELLSATRRA